MAVRNRLNRLVIQSPCPTSWEVMHGGDRARFCPHCNRHVHDLAALEARQVEALIEATGGRFCARIARDAAGRPITRQPMPAPAPARRASPLAAAVVGALVGLTGAAWAEAPAAPAAPGAADAATSPQPAPARKAGPTGAVLSGKVTDGQTPLPGAEVVARDTADGREHIVVSAVDGSFVLAELPAGVYEIGARLEGFDFPAETVRLRPGDRRQIDLAGQGASFETGVVILHDEKPLLQMYGDSSLVVVATVAAAAWTENGPIQTELDVNAVVKGEPGTRTVTANHDRPPFLSEDGDGLLRPGETVLAFLREIGDGPDGVYTATDPLYGLKQLPADALQAYQRRLSALAALGRHLPEPAEMAEWLVATVEDPLIRKEVVGELSKAVATATALAQRQSEPASPESEAHDSWTAKTEPARIGAALTLSHRDRLVRALLATDHLTPADLDLFELVGPWAGDEAVRWLIRRFQQGEPGPDWLAHRAMGLLASALDDPDLRQLIQEADREIHKITWRAELDRAEEIAAVEKDLRERFSKALQAR